MRYARAMDTVATCVPRSQVEAGLRALGASWNAQVPGAFASALERFLVHAELDGTASPTTTDVCFTGAAQGAADLLLEAARRGPRFGDAAPPPPPAAAAPALAGLTGWAALGAAVVLAGAAVGPPLVARLKTKKKRKRK